LVGQGYNKRSLRKIFEWNGEKTKAIKASELNYPSLSIAVPRTKIQYSVDIPRNLTYVGSTSSTYKAEVEIQTSTEGIEIEVEPKILDFTCKDRVQHFTVNVSVNQQLWTTEVVTAYLIWSEKEVKGSKHHIVRSPIVIIKK
jgi:hypothetical protein